MALPSGLQHSATCAAYARELLRERAGLAKARVPGNISHTLQVELEQVVDRFYRAWNNPVKLPYKLEDGGGSQFIASERDTIALIGVILSLVHPRLYDLQMEVLLGLHDGRIEVYNRDRFDRLLEDWSSPFTAFALIANRETPFHRDTKGGKMLLDLLATFGRYSTGRLEVPLLGSRFDYGPCTSLVFPGYLLEHGVGRVDGERICIASFFRPNVGFGVLPHYHEIPPPHIWSLANAHGLDIP